MDVKDASKEVLRRRSFSYVCQESMHFVYLLVDALGMSALGVEDDLFLEVTAIDEDVLIQICLPKEHSHSIL